MRHPVQKGVYAECPKLQIEAGADEENENEVCANNQ